MTSEDRHEAPDDALLVRYLLGSVPEDDAERFDELSVVDDDFVVRLSAIEHDLVDAYARGELSGEVLEQFRSAYLSSPGGREKVTFAETLLTYQSRLQGVRAPSRQSKPLSWVGVTRQWAFAGLTAVVLAACGYLLAENAQLRRQVTEARTTQADLRQREQQLQQQLESRRSADREAEAELARLRASLDRLETQNGTKPEPDRNIVISLMLTPITRGAGDLAMISVPVRATALELTLEVDPDEFREYRAALSESSTRRVVWRGGRVMILPGRIAKVRVPASLLLGQTYSLELRGEARSEPPRLVDSYAFRVVR